MTRRIFDTEDWHIAKAWGAGLEDTDARRHIGWYVDWLTRRGLVLGAYRRPDRVVDDMIVNAEGSAFSTVYYGRYYKDLAEIGLPLYRGTQGITRGSRRCSTSNTKRGERASVGTTPDRVTKMASRRYWPRPWGPTAKRRASWCRCCGRTSQATSSAA